MVSELYFWHKISKVLKIGQNKCPKMKTEKNFTRKISFIGTTYEGNFWIVFFQKFMIPPSSCSTGSLSIFFNLLYKMLKKSRVKFFWKINFGHLFLSIFENLGYFMSKIQLWDHNWKLASEYQKNNSNFVTIIFYYFLRKRLKQNFGC